MSHRPRPLLTGIVCNIGPWNALQRHCHTDIDHTDTDQFRGDLEKLSRMTMKLMQGYEKKGIGLDEPNSWSYDAVTFLSDTTSASSVRELSRVGQLTQKGAKLMNLASKFDK